MLSSGEHTTQLMSPMKFVCGLRDDRRYIAGLVQIVVPVFVIVTDTGTLWPTVIAAGTACESITAPPPRSILFPYTTLFRSALPNHSTPSWTILHWKL